MEFLEYISLVNFQSILAFLLFSIGALGFLIRRNALVALMCLELMLNGANLALVTYSKAHGNPEGNVLFLFVVLVAAAEAAIALSILVSLYRKIGSVYLDDFTSLRG